MTPRQKLQARDQGILERKFIHKVLTDEGQEFVAGHRQAIRRLLNTSGLLGSALSMSVSQSGHIGGSLSVSHAKRQRFLDMKTRKTKSGGTIRKKAYTIHNRELYGRVNNIIRQLSFGFTKAVKEKIQRDQIIEING